MCMDAAKYPSVSCDSITFECGVGGAANIYEVRLLDHVTMSSWSETPAASGSAPAAGALVSAINLTDSPLVEVTAGGELIMAGGTGNGYRLAEVMGATNPSGWSGVLRVKTPAGATVGYILLYSNP